MKRSVLVVILLVTLAAVISSAANANHYSYTLKVSNYNVIVTRLENNKVFLSLERTGQEKPRKEVYEAKYSPDDKGDILIRVPKDDGLIFAVLTDGITLQVELSNDRPGLKVEVWPPERPPVTGEKIKVDGKEVIRFLGNVGDGLESDMWLFVYRAVRNKAHVIDISQQSQQKVVPAEFRQAISTFRERRIK